MKHDEIQKLIADYLMGTMDKESEAVFFEMLRKNGYDLHELPDLKDVFGQIDDIPVPEPGESMHYRFYSMLENFKKNTGPGEKTGAQSFGWLQSFMPRKTVYLAAYGILLFIIGWAGGIYLTGGSEYKKEIHEMQGQILEMREMMALSLLKQSSASERIKGVNLTDTFTNVNDKILDALLRCLNDDPNVNVRINAVDALFKLAANSRVREGLIQSITRQESPLVQLALADVMIALQEKSSVVQLNKLLEKKDLDYAVKGRIEKTIRILM